MTRRDPSRDGPLAPQGASASRSLRRVLAGVLSSVAGAAALATAACDGAVRAPVAGDPLADASWEAGWAPEELTEEIRSTVWETNLLTRPPTFSRCPGVRVQLLLPRPDGYGPLVPAGETTTDAEGAFRIGGVPNGPWVIRTSKDGFAPVYGGRDFHVRGPMSVDFTSERPFGVQPSRRLTLRVVDRQSLPVAGAAIEILGYAFVAEAVSGVAGTVNVDVPAERVLVSVNDPGWEQAPTIVTPEEQSKELVSVRTKPLAGIVLSAEGERPIAGATVVWLDDRSRRVVTGPDGRFDLPVPRRGRIAAFADGWTWVSSDAPRAADMELILRRAPRIRGTVVDASGSPVPDARIYALGTDPEGPCPCAPGPLTGADGSFEMSWAPPPARGGRRWVYAWHRRLGLSALAEAPGNAGDEIPPVRLTLSGLAPVRGKVVRGNGEGVPHALVHATWTLDPISEREAEYASLPLRRAVATEADGSFALPDVPLDRTVRITAQVYGLERSISLNVGASRDRVLVEIPAGGDLRGRLVRADGGEPGARGTVTARLVDVPGTAYEVHTDAAADGTFAFEDVPKGRYLLRASAPGFDIDGAGEVRVGQEGDDAVRILLRRSARLSLRIVSGSDAPLPQAPYSVLVEDADDPSLPVPRLEFTPEEAAGVLDLGKCRAGRWRVRVSCGAWRADSAVLELGDGEAREVTVPLVRTLSLRVRLETTDGRVLGGERIHAFPVPLRDASGRILPPDPDHPLPPPVQAVTRDDGMVDVPGIHPGRWIVKASPRDRGAVDAEAEFPRDDVLVLRLPPTGDLTVRVRDASGAGVPEAIVSLRDAAGEPVTAWAQAFAQRTSRTRTDADGFARFRGVPVGPVVVTGSAGKAPLGPVEARVAEGDDVQVTLE